MSMINKLREFSRSENDIIFKHTTQKPSLYRFQGGWLSLIQTDLEEEKQHWARCGQIYRQWFTGGQNGND